MSDRRGRPAKPIPFRNAEGNASKRKLPPDLDLNSMSKLPDPPKRLGDHGRNEWNTTGKMLFEKKVLQSSDLKAFEAYCLSIDRYYRIVDRLNADFARWGDEALLILSPSGIPKMNPLLRIESEALDRMIVLASEFGLSPSSRAKLSLAGFGERQPNPVDERFFNRTKKRTKKK